MKKNIKTVSITCLILLLLVSELFAGEKPNWWNNLQQLTVFESTRSEVEKLFKPLVLRHERKFRQNIQYEYKTNEGILFVAYSLGKCTPESDRYDEDVEKDVLVMIGFTPKKPVKISNLNIDLSGFIAIKEDDSDAFYYRSRDLGIEYAIRNEKLEAVSYMLPKSKESLRCKQ